MVYKLEILMREMYLSVEKYYNCYRYQYLDSDFYFHHSKKYSGDGWRIYRKSSFGKVQSDDIEIKRYSYLIYKFYRKFRTISEGFYQLYLDSLIPFNISNRTTHRIGRSNLKYWISYSLYDKFTWLLYF
jgi:hypothetical protein